MKKKAPPENTSTDPVELYALDVTSGVIVAGPMVRSACKRHLDDLDNGESRGLKWDWPSAQRAIEFFPDVLRLSGGIHEGKPFKLEPCQQFIVGSLFGWKNASDDTRRFSVAYVEMGKGSGKSPLAAGIGLYMLTADHQMRAEVYAAACDKDQAKILFRDAVAMVEQSPELTSRITKSGGKDGDTTKVWNLAHLQSGSFFRPISSESAGRGKSGFRPHCVLLDEVHEHPTDAMVEFTRKNLKGRANALALMITNSGVVDVTSVCLRYHEYSERVLNGEQDDQFFAYVCGLDKEDDWKDPAVWKKSVPLLGVSVPESYLQQEVREAQGMPSKQSLTRRLNFCEWMGSASPFVSSEVWAMNSEPVIVEELRGRKCYGGLDLSEKNDLSALVLGFPMEDCTAVLPIFWAPEDTLREHGDRDRAPYAQWVKDGYLRATPGRVIGYDFIAVQLAELSSKYKIQAIAFDPWHIDYLAKELNALGSNLVLVKHGQGYSGGDLTMSMSITALEDELLDGHLRHGNHPILTWCVNNTKVETDAHANRKFDKRKATGRIDGAVALAEVCGLIAQEGMVREPEYQMMIL